MAKKIHLKIQFLFVVSKLKRFCHFDTQSLKHHNKCRHNNKPHTKNRMSQLSLIFICNCKNSFVSYYNLSEMQKKREKEEKNINQISITELELWVHRNKNNLDFYISSQLTKLLF